MKKYIAIFVTSLKNTLNYRGELAMWSIIDAMPLIGNIILWTTAFIGHDTIGGLTKNGIVEYYFIGYIFQQITGSHFEDHYVKQILSGNINGWLFKPLSLKKSMVVEELSWRVTGSIITLTPVIILGFILGIRMFADVSLVQIASLILVLGLGYFTDAIFSLAIVAAGFVFEEARSLMHLKWMVSWMFSGSMIPFELMPEWLEKISKALPFQARYYLPTNVYLGTINTKQTGEYIGILVFWAVILYIAIKWLWAKNLKKFSAVGS